MILIFCKTDSTKILHGLCVGHQWQSEISNMHESKKPPTDSCKAVFDQTVKIYLTRL